MIKKSLLVVYTIMVILLLCLPYEMADARGGGGGGRGGGGGGGRGSGGGGRASAPARGGHSSSRQVSSRPTSSRSTTSRQRSSYDYNRSAPRPVSRPMPYPRPNVYPSNIQRSPAGMNRVPRQLPAQARVPARTNNRLPYDTVQRRTTHPSRPTAPSNRPGQGVQRPSQADLDSFLQNKPDTRPDISNRPSTLPARPDSGDGATTLPSGPGISSRPERPGVGTRPGLPSLSNRPGERPPRPEQLPADWGNRWDQWQNQADNIRDEWHQDNYHHYHGDWYNDYWWDNYYHPYWPYYDDCDDCDWWSCPSTWTDIGSFIGTNLMTIPTYYTYGPGGSVYIAGDSVVLNDDQTVSKEEYTKELLGQTASIPEEASTEKEWMPLGVFTLVEEDAPEPTMYFQLAVNKSGTIAGMFQNTTTKNVVPIEGSVDSKTSRVVCKPTGKESPILETGLYNLIQNQTQVMLHFEDGKVRQHLLVRVDKPEVTKTEGSTKADVPPNVTQEK